MLNSLKGKSVIVTGAGSGIGRAAALLLAENGCDVVVADLDEGGGADTVNQIRELGSARAQFVPVDIGDEAAIEGMVAATLRAYGRLDGAVNCAGVPPAMKPVHELSADDWDLNLSLNTKGTALCLKHQILAMRDGGGGSIVAISSGSAIMAGPGFGEYAAAKAGLNQVCRTAAVENGAFNIRVNVIMPGITDTPMMRHCNTDESLAYLISRTPMARLGKPREVAEAALWFISDRSGWATGQVIAMDGGITLF